ncbi:hypothetical protein EIL87_07940 [Saccharopolyspora rhizosphaerae]|uniref:Uncharacterized protein n=1 Tax=Saccharopolyspora rhizosphaerae TaxID=2492662 RepID=A0A3R8P1U1_9PSEU|nr:hypothetical protein [Saccharopolyspora rhizosphaerae]RRO18168.1 hypothetical protein EIL87_07940 [Saccharopolyspora rhizosphaerae]
MLDKGDSLSRLNAELRDAETDEKGCYHLDTTQYTVLSLTDIGMAVNSAGLTVVRVISSSAGRILVLAHPQTTALSPSDGPFVPKAGLSPRELNWARERHRMWAKKFNRQFGLAFLHGVVGVITLVGALSSSEPAGGTRYYVTLSIAVLVLVLFGIAVLKATDARRKRWEEISHLLEW